MHDGAEVTRVPLAAITFELIHAQSVLQIKTERAHQIIAQGRDRELAHTVFFRTHGNEPRLPCPIGIPGELCIRGRNFTKQMSDALGEFATASLKQETRGAENFSRLIRLGANDIDAPITTTRLDHCRVKIGITCAAQCIGGQA